MANPLFEVTIAGDALNSFGFVNEAAIEGLGLNVFGFIWPCGSIWGPALFASLTTSWSTGEPSVTTNWSTGEPSVTTTWVRNDPNAADEEC